MSIDIDIGGTTTGFSDKKNISASIICSELGEAYIVDELNGIEIDVIYLDEISTKWNQDWYNQAYARGGVTCHPVEIVEVF